MERHNDLPAMSPDQLATLKATISRLPPSSVRNNYSKMLESCKLINGAPPSPQMIQELVVLWKQLWLWHGRR
jgi:hypothetical protein